MKKILALIMVTTVLIAAANLTFAQTIIIQSGSNQPTVIPIRPYGLNLKPATVPQRPRPPVTYRPSLYGGGPVVIENPHYQEKSLFEQIGEYLGRSYNRLR